MGAWEDAARCALAQERMEVALACALLGEEVNDSEAWRRLWSKAAACDIDGRGLVAMENELKAYLQGSSLRGWCVPPTVKPRRVVDTSAERYKPARDRDEVDKLVDDQRYVSRPRIYEPLRDSFMAALARDGAVGRDEEPLMLGLVGPWRSGKTLALRWLLLQTILSNLPTLFCDGEADAYQVSQWLESHGRSGSSPLGRYDGDLIVGIDLDGAEQRALAHFRALQGRMRPRLVILVTGRRRDVEKWSSGDRIFTLEEHLRAALPGVKGDPIRMFSFPVTAWWRADELQAAQSLSKHASSARSDGDGPALLDAVLLIHAIVDAGADPPEGLTYHGVALHDFAREIELIALNPFQRRVMMRAVARRMLHVRHEGRWVAPAGRVLAEGLRDVADRANGSWWTAVDALTYAARGAYEDINWLDAMGVLLTAMVELDGAPGGVFDRLVQSARAWITADSSTDPDWPYAAPTAEAIELIIKERLDRARLRDDEPACADAFEAAVEGDEVKGAEKSSAPPSSPRRLDVDDVMQSTQVEHGWPKSISRGVLFKTMLLKTMTSAQLPSLLMLVQEGVPLARPFESAAWGRKLLLNIVVEELRRRLRQREPRREELHPLVNLLAVLLR